MPTKFNKEWMAYNFSDKSPVLLKRLKQGEKPIASHWVKAKGSLGKHITNNQRS